MAKAKDRSGCARRFQFYSPNQVLTLAARAITSVAAASLCGSRAPLLLLERNVIMTCCACVIRIQRIVDVRRPSNVVRQQSLILTQAQGLTPNLVKRFGLIAGHTIRKISSGMFQKHSSFQEYIMCCVAKSAVIF